MSTLGQSSTACRVCCYLPFRIKPQPKMQGFLSMKHWLLCANTSFKFLGGSSQFSPKHLTSTKSNVSRESLEILFAALNSSEQPVAGHFELVLRWFVMQWLQNSCSHDSSCIALCAKPLHISHFMTLGMSGLTKLSILMKFSRSGSTASLNSF